MSMKKGQKNIADHTIVGDNLTAMAAHKSIKILHNQNVGVAKKKKVQFMNTKEQEKDSAKSNEDDIVINVSGPSKNIANGGGKEDNNCSEIAEYTRKYIINDIKNEIERELINKNANEVNNVSVEKKPKRKKNISKSANKKAKTLDNAISTADKTSDKTMDNNKVSKSKRTTTKNGASECNRSDHVYSISANRVTPNIIDKNLDRLREEFIRNKQDFEQAQYTMHINQIILNNILLKVEEQVYFQNYETEEQRHARHEREWLSIFRCCERGFESFGDFVDHREIVHKENIDDYCATSSPPSNYNFGSTGFTHGNTKYNNSSFFSTGSNYMRYFDDDIEMRPTEFKYIPPDFESSETDKGYKCEIAGCMKSYASAYGLRYHHEKGHQIDEQDAKPYKCEVDGCDKRYKNSNGLKYHMAHGH